MSDHTTKPEAFRIDSLSLYEIEAIEEAIGESFSAAGESGSLKLPYALYWIAKRREDPGLTYGEVKSLPMSTVTELAENLSESPLP